jgi:hypothetical protein
MMLFINKLSYWRDYWKKDENLKDKKQLKLIL